MTDWTRFQQCEVCGALLGKPCVKLSGFVVGAGEVAEVADAPHTGRKLRAGYSR